VTASPLAGGFGLAARAIAVAMTLYHVWGLVIRPTDPWQLRTVHLALAGTLVFLWPSALGRDRPVWRRCLDLGLVVALLGSSAYVLSTLDGWMFRAGVTPTGGDVVAATVLVAVLIEMIRRTAGWPLALLVVAFLGYALAGPALPWLLWHRGYAWDRVVTYLVSLQGVLGLPVAASATYVFLLVVLGAILEAAGAGRLFVEAAAGLVGRGRSGPATSSVLTGALFGTVSGSAESGVFSSGPLSIARMTAGGIRPAAAAAIVAVGAVGGQLVPPVMAAGAFLLAEMLGLPYRRVALVAVVPALLYYAAVTTSAHLAATRVISARTPRPPAPPLGRLIGERGHLLLPLAILVYFLMVEDVSPFRAAFWASVIAVAVSWASAETRLRPRALVAALGEGSRRAADVAAACAAAGIIVGVLALTGLGTTLTLAIADAAGQSRLPVLAVAVVVVVVSGLGMPPTAAYAVTASALGPALVEVGLAPLAAHLFLFYLACLSAVTPPVARAACAAAAIAGVSRWDVAFRCLRLTLAAYAIPFALISRPALLLEAPWISVGVTVVVVALGVMAIAAALSDGRLGLGSLVQRALLLVAGICLLIPGRGSTGVGLAVLATVVAVTLLRRRFAPPPAP
jgi:TRAP transporter 4TM/12TM fusion protein